MASLKEQTITLKHTLTVELDYEKFLDFFYDGKDNDTALKVWEEMLENTDGEYDEIDEEEDDIDNYFAIVEGIKEEAEQNIEIEEKKKEEDESEEED